MQQGEATLPTQVHRLNSSDKAVQTHSGIPRAWGIGKLNPSILADCQEDKSECQKYFWILLVFASNPSPVGGLYVK